MALVSPTADKPDLAVVALSVLGDLRPLPELQPPLPEGIHLRWAFPREKGFPWYGFYLFRRLTPPAGSQMTCASSQLGGFTPGPRPSPDLTIPLGTFHSDQNLVLTDQFPNAGTVELDLSGRQFVELQLPLSNPASAVEVSIGFVTDFPQGGSFGPGGAGGTDGVGTTGGLGNAGGAASDCACGCAHEAVRPIAERVVALAPGQFSVTFGYDNTGASAVSLPVGTDNGFFPTPAGRGQPTLLRPGRHTGAFTVVFDGRPLTWRLAGHTVTVSASDAADGSGGSGGSGPTTADGILVTAYLRDAVVATGIAAGRAGEIKVVPLAFEEIDRVRITAGPARLVDVCVRATSAGGGQGWAPAPGFTQPLLLPVQHPNYPLQHGTPSAADSRARALPRIRYAFPVKPPTIPPTLDTIEWSNDDSFLPLFDTLSKVVSPGPPHITDFVENVQAAPDPSDPDATPPVSTAQSSLELLLGAAANPAMAQMLGLYWIDDGVVAGQSYDYTLVADYENTANGDVQTVLALVTAENYDHLTAYQRKGVLHAAGASLPPPQNVGAYDLPVGGVPANAPGDVAGQVGLTWDIPTISPTSSRLARDASILFHLWRHDYGRLAPSSSTDESTFQQATTLPVAPGDLRTQGTDASLPGWPAVSLFALDGPLIEGWYGYRASGIDIFGRHSARSAPAPWKNAGAIHEGDPAIAVHIMDTMPPPAPTAVQAWMLEPGDVFAIQDQPYTLWRERVGPTKAGLRVRWIWTGKQMRQAPDAKEFRIYVQAGSSMVGSATVGNWLRRIAVVGFGEAVQEALVPLSTAAGAPLTGNTATASATTVSLTEVALDGIGVDALELELSDATGGRTRFGVLGMDPAARTLTLDAAPQLAGSSRWKLGIVERTYEVFLPSSGLAAPEDFNLPWAPTDQAPVAYGLVGVGAADDKTNERAIDIFETPATRSALVPRPGNEGAVGGPAAVVQVLRTTPLPPTLPIDEATLSATRADFNSRSFFNLHYPRLPDLFTHVYRAVDESLFAFDSHKRFPASGTPSADGPNAVTAQALGWQQPQRFQNAANQITALTPSGYASLTPDALRLLASLPSNAEAFTCLTATPLDPDRPDAKGRSDDKNYQENSALSAYEDTLDGRATNVYFYRTAKANRAHTVSDLGASTPPVTLPTAVLPGTPMINAIVPADRAIGLRWQPVPQGGVSGYRVYRAASAEDAGSLSSMGLVREILLAQLPDVNAPSFTDAPLVALQPFYYRLTSFRAADSAESVASPVVSARAQRIVPPAAPTAVQLAAQPGPTVLVAWSVAEPLQILVQRRATTETTWRTLSDWLAEGTSAFVDGDVAAGTTYQYRLRARDAAQIQSELTAALNISV